MALRTKNNSLINKVLVLIVLSTQVFALGLHAQDDISATRKKTRLFDVSASTGIWPDQERYSNLDDFRILAPESQILNRVNIGDFIPGPSFRDDSRLFAVHVGIQPVNRKTNTFTNAIIRLGFSFGEGSLLSQSLSYENRFSFDTLVSQQSDTRVIMDSLLQASILCNYTHQQLGLDFSIMFSTGNDSRWSVYGGAALGFAMSIDAYTSIQSSSSVGVMSYWPSTNASQMISRSGIARFDQESFRNKTDYTAAVCLPLGIDFRMGDKSDFLRRIHLFIEMRPGIHTVIIPGLQTITEGYFQQYFGARVRI